MTLKYIKVCGIASSWKKCEWDLLKVVHGRARLSLVSTLCGPLAPWGTLCHTIYEVIHLESNNKMKHLDEFFIVPLMHKLYAKGWFFYMC